MDKSDKFRQVTGYGAWHIGDIHVSDGPHGMRTQDDGAKNNESFEATCFPTASGIACSWNRRAVRAMACAIGEEARELGVSVVLGPGVNIKRSPLCGRNFEYFSEDPYLAGELASEYVEAIQADGTGTSLKHFACNNQETHRMTSNSMVDERALHEIYLSAFERVVKKAKPATVMASYNYINGKPACENKYLLTDVLRDKWGYEGLVMSDWGACVDLPACIGAGMDVEMPDSKGNHYDDLLTAVYDGSLPEEVLDRAVSRVEELNNMYPDPLRDGDRSDRCVTYDTRKAHHSLAKRLSEESAVLLKNDSFLPLREGTQILIIGDLAARPRIQGGGSSHINTEHIASVSTQFARLGAVVTYVRGYNADASERDIVLEREAIFKAAAAVKHHVPILFFGGLTDMAEGEGYDRASYDLPGNQSALLKQLLNLTDRIGFISFSGAPYDMELPDRCRAVLQMYLGGESVAGAVASIVMGQVNPSGKLAESIPYSDIDVASYGYFGRQGEQIIHPDDVEYRESVFVGYRYYDTFDIPVRYCFGHGLSYTEFSYSGLKIVSGSDDTPRSDASYDTYCTVVFTVENTGSVAGSEICEVYVRNPDTGAFRPKRELRGFAKVHLDPGEKKKVEISLERRAFSVYQDDEFRLIRGTYEIQVGASLDDIRLTQTVEVDGEDMDSPLTLNNRVPLTSEEFDLIYAAERTNLSDTRPGGFTRRNSLAQMMEYSSTARRWAKMGSFIVRMMLPGKPADDPEVRMMTEGLLEGNIDSVSNQSSGLMSYKTVQALVDAANRGE